MDTGRIKRFAIEARTVLMQGVRQRLKALGFSDSGKASEEPRLMDGGCVFMGEVQSSDFYTKWMSLNSSIQSRSMREVAEEAAYTWFNRFMAIRIMAKQEFISPVLAYESDDVRVPVIVSEARQGRMPRMNEAVRSQLMELLDDDSRTSEQFALLIVAYCHENPIINKCFGAIADYTELLLPQNILSEGGFVDMINHTEFITDEQYASAELIGWLYQFYISDRKDEAFAKKGKYDQDEIAPATQIFTPNWIVKYMAENTLGRIYIDNNPYSDIKDNLKYLVDAKPSSEPLKIDDLSQMTVADLACGSGHILNECFDLLYSMYIEEGYSRQQAIRDILLKNLVGIDLDTRAKQLASFALLMKACQKDRSFLDGRIMPRVYDMPRPMSEVMPDDWFTSVQEERDLMTFLKGTVPHYMMGCNDRMTKEIADVILLMEDAGTLGSIMKFDISESTRNAILIRTREYEELIANGEFVPEANQLFIPYMNIILALTEKYAALCMNPPYMGSGRFDAVLSKYTKDNYPRSKADLFSVFMDVAIDRLAPNGKYGMINMHSWMFLSSFEELRRDLLENYTIDSLLHLGPRTFDELNGEVVQNAAFIISNSDGGQKNGTYFRLVDCKNCGDKERLYLEALIGHTEKVYFAGVGQANFDNIPGSPVGYWASISVLAHFKSDPAIGSVAELRQGLTTTDNNKYVRNWSEVSRSEIGIGIKGRKEAQNSNKKWFPFNKGGHQRFWYGNNDLVVNFQNDGYEIKEDVKRKYPYLKGNTDFVVKNQQFYFKRGLTWSALSSDDISFRAFEDGFICADKGQGLYSDESDIKYLQGLMNSKVAMAYLQFISPTLDYNCGYVAKVPVASTDSETKSDIELSVENNITVSRLDWDAHETSWDFKVNELLRVSNGQTGSLEDFVSAYRTEWERYFETLHENEEELNRQFIDIYGLQDELTPDVPLSEITILQAGEITHVKDESEYGGGHYVWNYDNLMKQLISYAVGCMMGRYSIDKPGLILANQGDGLSQFNELVPDSRFEPDDDGIIPLMSSNTEFADAASKRFKTWLATAFGEENLQENLNFVRSSLGKDIDDYFVKDFWKDHKKMYQNRPIYWLFSSKKGAFQCLAYMHRMNPYTAETIRTKYLLPHIEWLTSRQNEMQENAANLTTRERKELDGITAQIAECREYHDRLHVVADQQIGFDLDDGVVVNYAKFGDVLSKLK